MNTPDTNNCEILLVGGNQNTGRFSLQGEINFYGVMSLNQQALKLFLPYREIDIDLSGITYLNSAALALLLEWKRETTNQNKLLRLSNIPEKLLNIAHVCEVDNLISAMS